MDKKRLIDNEWITIDECYDKHKKFVTQVCKKYLKPAHMLGLERQEIINVAVIGMISAYKRFDQEKGFKFVTFAGRYMSGEVQRYLRDYGKMIKFSRTSKETAGYIHTKEMQNLSNEEVAERLNVNVRNVEEAKQYMNFSHMSMEYEFDTSEPSAGTLHDIYGHEQDRSMIYVDDFMEGLDERDRFIVDQRLQDVGQREVGSMIGISQVQVSRLLNKIGQQYKEYEGEFVC